MGRPELTPEQRAEADRIFAALQRACQADLRALAELLAANDDRTTFGPTEFAVRDIVLRVGAKAIEAALEGRKKGATTAPAAPARAARRRPSSSAGRPGGS
jgi:hypothetical protein